MKKKPTGFIAICQCGAIIAAMDYNRTDRKEAGKLLGKWISDGCTIEPKFESCWSANLTRCMCKASVETALTN